MDGVPHWNKAPRLNAETSDPSFVRSKDLHFRAHATSLRQSYCLQIVWWPHAKHAANEKERFLPVQKTHRKDRMDCWTWNPKSGTPTELLSPNLKSKRVVLHCHRDVRIKPFVRLSNNLCESLSHASIGRILFETIFFMKYFPGFFLTQLDHLEWRLL